MNIFHRILLAVIIYAAYDLIKHLIRRYILKIKPDHKWVWVSEQLPEPGIEVLGFNEDWIDEDFNPDGIRLCYLQDSLESNWVMAKWCNSCDEWHTRYSKGVYAGGASERYYPIDSDEPNYQAPQRWMPKPKRP